MKVLVNVSPRWQFTSNQSINVYFLLSHKYQKVSELWINLVWTKNIIIFQLTCFRDLLETEQHARVCELCVSKVKWAMKSTWANLPLNETAAGRHLGMVFWRALLLRYPRRETREERPVCVLLLLLFRHKKCCLALQCKHNFRMQLLAITTSNKCKTVNSNEIILT